MPSGDMNVKDAQIKIAEMNSVEEINAFITGDERKTVLDAAAARIKDLEGLKQGEQPGPITQTKADFKSGVQKTKDYVTGEDVIKKLRQQGVKI